MKNEVSTSNKELEDKIIQVIKTVYDPEIPVDIYELGLIYSVTIKDNFDVDVVMTLTSPACPVAGTLPKEVEDKIACVKGVEKVTLELTFDPPWDKEMMTEDARFELGMM
ncbi:MAG: FeS assembly SUF system protein [Sphingobacteriales bacterium]|jgi:FeS assembly SUF system protein